MNSIATMFGIAGLLLLLLVIFPVLGAVSGWLALSIGIIGLIFSTFSRKKSGRTLNIIVIAIALVRLLIGKGLL